MAKVINLKTVKKRKSRDEARKKGDENAALYGERKSQKQQRSAEITSLNAHLDGHKRDK